MAISLSKAPQNFSFAGNPIPIEFDAGVVAENSTIIIAAQFGLPPNQATMILYFDNEVETIVYDFNSFADFYTYLSEHYVISRYFDVTYQATPIAIITLTAFSKDDLNLSIIDGGNYAPTTVNKTDGGNEAINVLLGIDVYDGVNYTPINFDKKHKIDNDGIASFNIAAAFVFEPISIPTTALNSSNPFTFNTQQYRLSFAEESTNGISAIYRSSDFFAVNGQFSKAYLETAIDATTFLTASPRYLSSKDNEPRFLSFISTKDFTNLLLLITAYDYSDVSSSYEFELVDTTKGEVLNIPVGYNQIGLGNLGGSPFWKYSIHLEYDFDGQTYESESFTIECNRANDLNDAVFLFLNSRGGLDTIAFVGETECETDFDGLQYQRTQTSGLNEVRTEQHRLQERFKQYSGQYDDYESYVYIAELLNSEQVFWYKDNELKPIIINRDSFDKASEHDDLFEMDFNFTLVTNDVAPDLQYAAFVAIESETIVVTEPTLLDAYNPSE